MLVKYCGPSAAVQFPTTGQIVARGETVDVPNGTVLGDAWTIVDYKKMTVPELRAAAEADGIDIAEHARKRDLITALTGAESEED